MVWLRHVRLQADVGAFVDGELSAPRLLAVAAHLRECWVCSGESEAIRCVRAALRRTRSHGPVPLAVRRLTRFSHGLQTG